MEKIASTNRIHAVHLLNDFSGSPLVFREALIDLSNQGNEIFVYTATPDSKGFLTGIASVIERPIFYRWSKNKVLTLIYFLLAQATIFFKILRYARKNDLVYVNTLLPFGALLAARLKGAKTRLHVHEVSLTPLKLKQFLVYCAEKFADEIIFVSNYVKSQYQFKKPQSKIIFNKLPQEFIDQANESLTSGKATKKTVLMLCSMKAYKGIYEFIEIAKATPLLPFELVLNAAPKEVNAWKDANSIPSNCEIFSSQSNTHPFYERACVVMNLSRPDEWIETFGMTILEAMAYQCFVITPTAGGPLELLNQYHYGIAIDGKNIQAISAILIEVFAKKNPVIGVNFQNLEFLN